MLTTVEKGAGKSGIGILGRDGSDGIVGIGIDGIGIGRDGIASVGSDGIGIDSGSGMEILGSDGIDGSSGSLMTGSDGVGIGSAGMASAGNAGTGIASGAGMPIFGNDGIEGSSGNFKTGNEGIGIGKTGRGMKSFSEVRSDPLRNPEIFTYKPAMSLPQSAGDCGIDTAGGGAPVPRPSIWTPTEMVAV